jgi:hypothetical protein
VIDDAYPSTPPASFAVRVADFFFPNEQHLQGQIGVIYQVWDTQVLKRSSACSTGNLHRPGRLLFSENRTIHFLGLWDEQYARITRQQSGCLV